MPPPSTQPTRREVAAEEARSRILAAAADCLVRDGLAQVRMARIADAAQVSSGLLHYHFSTKEQLFAEVLGYSHARTSALTQQALERAGEEPARRLSTFLDRCLPSDARLRHDWLLWQELDLLCLRRPELARASADLYGQLYDAATEIVVDGIDAGVFAVGAHQARELAETAVALCDGLGARVLAQDDLALETVRERLAVAVGRLLGHDGPLPRPDRALQQAPA